MVLQIFDKYKQIKKLNLSKVNFNQQEQSL